jgi:Flp pilus assembly protein TadD
LVDDVEPRTRNAAWRLEPDLRLEEARAQLETAVELDPLSAIVHGCLGHHLIFRREYQQAAEELRLAVELEPAYWWAHVYLAASYGLQGSFDKAEGVMQKLLSVTGGCPLVIGSYAFGYGAIGDCQRAEQLRNQLLTSVSGYVPPLALAWSHLGLGEAESCLDWLEKAVEERDPLIVEFQPKPIYDGLLGHPQFSALLSAMHLDRR